MTIHARLTFFTAALFFVFCTDFAALAEETSKYGQWESADDRLKQMISDLDRLIEEGRNSRAAHPEFLKDLQKTVDSYKFPEKTVYFSDDFSDNDFWLNPSWIVAAGDYSVDRYGSLYSSVPIRRPAQQEKSADDADDDRGLRILLGVLNELSQDEKDHLSDDGPLQDQALIYSKAEIPNSFTLRFSFRSTAVWGSATIGIFQDDNPTSGYQLVYQASPADGRPIQLLRYRYGKPYIIEEVHENSPDLDDGLDHVVQLDRTPGGEMVVTIDGGEILRTSDLSLQGDFSGVAIINNGGSYSYDNIEIYAEQRK